MKYYSIDSEHKDTLHHTTPESAILDWYDSHAEIAPVTVDEWKRKKPPVLDARFVATAVLDAMVELAEAEDYWWEDTRAFPNYDAALAIVEAAVVASSFLGRVQAVMDTADIGQFEIVSSREYSAAEVWALLDERE